MEDQNISLMRHLAYERGNGWSRMIVPRHSEVIKTSYLDVQNLTLNTFGIGKDRKMPSIRKMLMRK